MLIKLNDYDSERIFTEENFKEYVELAEKLNDLLTEISDKSKAIVFLTTKDIQEATGFSKKTVERLFADPEFPSCNFGKGQVAEIHAVIEYFSVPRRKNESAYWLNIA